MNLQPPMLTTLPPPSRPMTPTDVVLIGTVHLDRRSYRALRGLIVALSPSVIATEMSRFGLAFRQGPGRRIRCGLRRYLRKAGLSILDSGEVGARILKLGMPFEYLAAHRAARRAGARLEFLGRDRDSAAWLTPLAHDAWNDARIAEIAALPRDLKAELAVARARALDSNTMVRPGFRDRIYARRIRELAESGERVVAVLGWEHVRPDVSENTAWILHNGMPQLWFVAGGDTFRLG